MPGVGNKVHDGVATPLEHQGVVLGHMDVVGAVDHQHRAVAVLVEQRTQGELRPAHRQFPGVGRRVESHRVADDPVHPEGVRPLTGERRFDRAAQHHGGIDLTAETRPGRVVPAHRDAHVRHHAVAQRTGVPDQSADHFPAAGTGHRYGRLPGSRDVEHQHPGPQMGGEEHHQPVHIHLPAVHSSAGEHHGPVGGEVEGCEQVDRDTGRAPSVGQFQYVPVEPHPEAGSGELVLVELLGERDALALVGQGGELRPAVGQRRLLMGSRVGVGRGQLRPFMDPAAGSVRPHLGDRGAHGVDVGHRQSGVDHLRIPLAEQLRCVQRPLIRHDDSFRFFCATATNADILR